MANLVYNNYLKELLSGSINVTTSNIYAALLSGAYAPDVDHVYYSQISGYEVTDPLGSYVKGGQLLAGKTITLSNDEAIFDANDVIFNTATITASGVALWKSGASATEHKLICWTELGNTTSVNGTFQITWSPTNGIYKVGAQ